MLVPVRERSVLLRVMRSVCWLLRSACNECAQDLHKAQLAFAARFVKAFPIRLHGCGVPIWSVQGWGARAIELIRIRCCDQGNRCAPRDAALLKAFNVDGSQTMHDLVSSPDIFYDFVTGTRESRYRVEVQNVVHVDLGTVETFFNARGWKLDRSGALLVLQACSKMLDAGSSWCLNEHHNQISLASERFDLLSATIVDALRTEEGRAELVSRLRTRFDREWVSATFDVTHKSITICGSHGYAPLPSSVVCRYNGHYQLCAQELMDRQESLLDLVARVCKSSDAFPFVERKLNACFPKSALNRAATIPHQCEPLVL